MPQIYTYNENDWAILKLISKQPGISRDDICKHFEEYPYADTILYQQLIANGNVEEIYREAPYRLNGYPTQTYKVTYLGTGLLSEHKKELEKQQAKIEKRKRLLAKKNNLHNKLTRFVKSTPVLLVGFLGTITGLSTTLKSFYDFICAYLFNK